MKLVFHTKAGQVIIDSDDVRESDLAYLGITASSIVDMLPRDLRGELDDLRLRVKQLESR